MNYALGEKLLLYEYYRDHDYNVVCLCMFLDDTNVSINTTPVDEERAFEQSDTDEMSENSVHPVPRGIVNPNYPGFQHLAHTLQVRCR